MIASPGRNVIGWLDERVGSYSLTGLSVIAIRVGGAALGLGAQILASRLIGAEAFGYYALALVWLLLLGHGATSGANQLICRLLSSYRTSGQPEAAAGLLRFAFVMGGGVAVTLSVLGMVLVGTGILALDDGLVVLAILTLAVVPLIVLQDLLEAIGRGLDKPNLGIAPAIMLRHVAIIIGVLALMAWGRGADAVTIMGFTVGGLLASVLVQASLLRRHLRAELAGARPTYRIGFWVRTTLPIALLDAADVLFNNADILILGLFVPPEMVAAYFAATRLAQILAYVPYGVTAATAQKYAALAVRDRFDELQRLVGSVALLSTVLTLAGGMVLWIMAGPLLALFGEGFETATAIVPILCLGIVLVCALGPGEDVLTMLGQERICSLVFAIAVTANLVLNFILIPDFGMLGAAIATVCALALRGVLLAGFAYTRLGLALPIGTHRLARTKLKGAL